MPTTKAMEARVLLFPVLCPKLVNKANGEYRAYQLQNSQGQSYATDLKIEHQMGPYQYARRAAQLWQPEQL